MPITDIRQRADYTFKHNNTKGRHGWLRLTPAYSVRVVNEILEGMPKETSVLDPFAGTSTTALCASYLGHTATTVEINPFSVWLGRAKLDNYSTDDIEVAGEACELILERIRSGQAVAVEPPPIHNITRWWNSAALRFLCELKGEIRRGTEEDTKPRTLLNVAFCRTMIKLSNAAFNHQSMSFHDGPSEPLEESSGRSHIFENQFRDDLSFVLRSAAENPEAEASIIEGDATQLEQLSTASFDLLITSPPYANRMSYIRELRPYMYWMGFLNEAREAGELDWRTIGGTWGIATSRLQGWVRNEDAFRPAELDSILTEISHANNQNGALLARYVEKYLEDMWDHFVGVSTAMRPGGRVHYIVGNSSFYGRLVPVEKFYAEMLQHLGFTDISIRTIRKRNSKKELFEFDVSAKAPH